MPTSIRWWRRFSGRCPPHAAAAPWPRARCDTPGRRAAELDVGGDWDGAFRLPDGRLAIVIGDVVGRGLNATVTMGQVRQAIRVATLDGRSPADVLGLQLNREGRLRVLEEILGMR